MPRARRTQNLGATVFTEFTLLAQKSGAVNLGQGFPDFDGPDEIKDAAIEAIRSGVNQYAAGPGAPLLRRAIAGHAARFHGQAVDPDSMITVTSGATEALFDALLGLVDPGDEVVLFEPFYDSYIAGIELSGGVAKSVLLRPPDGEHKAFWFEPDELRAAFSEKTKMVILNTPHNPTGKVFTRAELEQIAALCEEHDVLALVDEVYEHLAYAPARHLRFATLPGMDARTLTVSSAGKSFSLTGWKIGWAIGPQALRAAVQSVHQFVTFASAAPLQHAVARALALPDSFFAGQREALASRRDRLAAALGRAGLPALACEGAYFLLADISAARARDGAPFKDDFAFCRDLTERIGVAAIPSSAFYSAARVEHGQPWARFAFCKREETIAEAEARLANLSRSI
jgi:N-succinyldiaminopimelate aminotransferase